MMIDDGNEDAAKTVAPLTTSAHRRSNHDRQGRGTVFGETGAHGSALYKLCESRKVPFLCCATWVYVLLTQIVG